MVSGTCSERAGRIVEARRRRGWRRSDLVTYSKLSDNTVAAAERYGKVTQRTAEMLARVLGLSVEELLR